MATADKLIQHFEDKLIQVHRNGEGLYVEGSREDYDYVSDTAMRELGVELGNVKARKQPDDNFRFYFEVIPKEAPDKEKIIKGTVKLQEEISSDIVVMDFEGILKDFGVTKEEIIEDKPQYAKIFNLEERYRQAYEANPSDILRNTYNNYVVKTITKLKEDFPERFTVEAHLSEEEKHESKFQEVKNAFPIWIETVDINAITEWFEEESTEEEQKKLLTDKNYHVFEMAFRHPSIIIIDELTLRAKKAKIYTDMLTSRNGNMFALLISATDKMEDADYLKDAVDTLKKSKSEAAKLLKSQVPYQVAMETNNPEIMKLVDGLYDSIGAEKPSIMAEAEEAVSIDQAGEYVKWLKEISSGEKSLDEPVILSGRIQTEFHIVEDIEQVVRNGGKAYHIIYKKAETEYYQQTTLIHSQDGYVVAKVTLNDFEKHYGASRYQVMRAWINMLNLASVNDTIALMYIARISETLMVERDNKDLRNAYKERLSEILVNPTTNKIANRYFNMNNSHLTSLQSNGFLDGELCPTKLFYLAVVLHSFEFPKLTHPYEYVGLTNLEHKFTYNILQGNYQTETIYTDGDLLYNNPRPTPTMTKPTAQMDASTARTIIKNLTAVDRADMTKKAARIDGFLPFLYAVPTTNVMTPTFKVKMMSMPKRKIMWGVYCVGDNGEKILANSYAISSIISMNRGASIMAYEGQLSQDIFTAPKNGVIVEWEGTILAVRGLNKAEFLSHNYNEKYFNKTLSSPILQTISNSVDEQFGALLIENNETRVSTVYPAVIPDVAEPAKEVKKKPKKPTLKAPAPPKKKPSKPLPKKVVTKRKVKKVVRRVARQDDRVYLSKKEAEKKIQEDFMPVFMAVKGKRGIERDEGILTEMDTRGLDRIAPATLLYLGFDLLQHSHTDRHATFGDYELRMPNLDWHYYLSKK